MLQFQILKTQNHPINIKSIKIQILKKRTFLHKMINEQSEFLVSNQSLFFLQGPNKKDLYCKMHKLSKHACMNKNCTKFAFVCQTQFCKCHDEHKECLIVKTQTLIKNIYKKIVSIKPLEDAINETIDKFVDGLSDFRDQILIKIKQQFEFCGLNFDQINILRSIDSGSVEEINGQQMFRVSICGDYQNEIKLQIEECCKIIKQALEEIKTVTEPMVREIQKLNLSLFRYSEDNRLIILQKKVTHSIAKNIKGSLFKNSKIINQLSQMGALFYWFQPKTIKTTTLLYRASQNQFSTSKFHQNCDNIRNTLVLCQTTSGKVIGGYSALNWQVYMPQDKQENTFTAAYSVDQTGQSFMFSLTHKDKFRLKEDKKSILWWTKQSKVGPSFGGAYDLVIHDKANENNYSYINLNGSYFNQLYELEDGKKDNQRFIGSSAQSRNGKGNSFSLKEWQVWSIQFCRQQNQGRQFYSGNYY